MGYPQTGDRYDLDVDGNGLKAIVTNTASAIPRHVYVRLGTSGPTVLVDVADLHPTQPPTTDDVPGAGRCPEVAINHNAAGLAMCNRTAGHKGACAPHPGFWDAI